MSSKSKTYRNRYTTKTYTKIKDFDTPTNNSEDTVISSTIVTTSESNSGVDRPTWRSIIASRGDAVNACSASMTEAMVSPSSAELSVTRRRLNGSPPLRIVYRTELTRWESAPIFLTFPTPGSHRADATTEATRNFVSAARRALSPANLGQTFGELNETLGLLRSPGRALINGFGSYLGKVNKNLARNKRAPKAVKRRVMADTWLEYSFGWLPLISDAEDIAKAAAKMAVGFPGTRISKSISTSGSETRTSDQQSFPGCGAINYDILTKTTTKCSVYGMIRPDLAAPGNFPQSFGLQLNNFLPTVWELIPWSFAIDYFTGVGDFISSLCFPTSSLQYFGRSRKTTVERSTAVCGIVGDTKKELVNLSVRTTFSPGSSVYRSIGFTRDKPTHLIAPASFRLPAAKTAYANLAALATLRLSQPRRS